MLKATITLSLAATAMASPASLYKKTRGDESRSYDCPEGYDLQGKQCIMKEFHEQSLICPAGTKEIGDKCLTYTSLLKKCPEGYRSAGKQCVRPITEPASPYCDDDFTLDGETCTKQVERRPYCPQGSTEDDNGCSIYRPHESECPEGYRATGKGCAKTITHPKYPQCNKGFELEKDECVKFVDVPAFCPAGYRDTKHGCARFAPRQSECPEGYRQAGKGCIKVHKFPRVPTCSDEYTLEGNSCVKFVPNRPFCPSPFREDSDAEEGCSLQSPKDSECPQGFNRVGDSCKKIHTFPKVPVCDKEYILENNSCTKQVPVPAFCPAGYKQGKEGCAQFTSKLSKCPEGFRQTGKGCIRIHRFEKHPECSAEYTLEGNSCVKYVDIPAFCPAGYTDGKEGCHKVTPKLSKCPEGFTQSHKGCKKVITFPRVPSCDNDYNLEKGECKKVVPVPSYSVCKSGVKVGDNCVTKTTAAKEYVCSKGATLQGNHCVSTETFDCSTTVSRTVCNTPAPPTKGNYWLRNLGIKKNNWSSYSSSKSQCQQVSERVPKTCTKSNKTPAQGVCPAGYEQHGKTCTSTISTPAEIITPQPRIVSAAPKLICPQGGCSHTEKAELDHFCPNGWFQAGDRCLQTAEKIQPAPRKVTVPAKMVCNGGTGIACIDKEEAALEHYCPDSYTQLGERCIKTAELIQPAPRTVSIPAKQVCSGGNGFACTETEEAELIWSCPRLTIEIRGRCLKLAALIRPRDTKVEVPANMVCSGGDGALCTTTEKAELNYFCSNGYTQLGDRCIETADKINPPPRKVSVAPNMVCSAGNGHGCIEIETAELNHFCPRGTIEIRDKCVKILAIIRPRPRTVTSAVKYQCTKGFNLNGKTCLTRDIAEYDQYCADGYYSVGDKCAKSAEHLSVCKIGTKTKNSCVVTKTAPPKVTIVRQCTKGEAGC